MNRNIETPRSQGWQRLDTSDDPAAFVDYLDRAASELAAVRQEVIRSLDVKPDSSVLDVGCGAGEFVIEVAQSADAVRAVGVDASELMVETAATRARAAGVDVTFSLGDAQHLQFPDASFDRVHCSRVLMHLDDPAAAVAEMARLLVPGGRVAIVEPDHDAVMLDSDDLAVARAVRTQLAAAIKNPDIGRRVQRLLIERGMEVLEVTGRAIPLPPLETTLKLFPLWDYLESAVNSGQVEAGRAAGWRKWLEAADAGHRLGLYGVLFCVVAVKR